MRHAILWIVLGAFLLVLGGIGLAATGEALVAFVSGLFGLGSGVMALREHLPRWHAWRAVGDVSLELDGLTLVAGGSATLRLHVRPRRDLVVPDAGAALVADLPGAQGAPPGTTPFEFPLIPGGTTLRAGERAVFEVVVTLPEDVMTSWYDDSGARRWTLVARLRSADGATWSREYPVFVVPSPDGVPAGT